MSPKNCNTREDIWKTTVLLKVANKPSRLAITDSRLIGRAILRAGIGMIDGILALLPEARVGHLGVYRDETTMQPVHASQAERSAVLRDVCEGRSNDAKS